MNKYLVTIIIIITFNIHATAQYNHYKDQGQINFGAYKKDLGYGLNFGGQYFVENGIAIQGQLIYDWARPYQAYYTSYGLDFGVSYSAFELGNNVYVNLKGFGAVASQKVTDKAEISKSIFNYGAKAGGGIEYYLNKETAIELSCLQGFFLQKGLGQKMYEIGITFKFSL